MNLTDGDRELLVIALDHYIATAMRSSQIEKLGSLIDKLEANEPDVAVVPNVVGVNMVELHDTIMSLIDSVSDEIMAREERAYCDTSKEVLLTEAGWKEAEREKFAASENERLARIHAAQGERPCDTEAPDVYASSDHTHPQIIDDVFGPEQSGVRGKISLSKKFSPKFPWTAV